MSPGKAAAQASHAVMMLASASRREFVNEAKRTVIVLAAKNAEQIRSLEEYLDGMAVDNNYYIDEGMNEVDAYSVTALAAYAGCDDEVKSVFEQFELFGGNYNRDPRSSARKASDEIRNVMDRRYYFKPGVPSHVYKTLKWLKKQ